MIQWKMIDGVEETGERDMGWLRFLSPVSSSSHRREWRASELVLPLGSEEHDTPAYDHPETKQ